MSSVVYTIGHSSHPAALFLRLLEQHAIEVLVDVRSAPYSRFAPQFDREVLQASVMKQALKYLYMGEELGGRPRSNEMYDKDGRVLYSRITHEPAFQGAIDRLQRGMATFRVALMCAEEDPAHCHRRLLVSRVLMERGHTILHIRGDGHISSEDDVTRLSGKPLLNEQPALFAELDEEQWRSSSPVAPR